MKRIFLTGLGATTIHKIEEQLGNAAIITGMMDVLPRIMDDAEVVSNVQVTDEFCEANSITSIRDPSLYTWNRAETLRSLWNLFRTGWWRLFKKTLGSDVGFLRRGGLLDEYWKADVILDLNGDVYSQYLGLSRFIKHSADIWSATNLGRPVVEFASSPGPFTSWFRKFVARAVLKRLTVISNREPVSSAIVEQLGVGNTPVITACCPAFHLPPSPGDRTVEILESEGVPLGSRPLAGVVIAGTNMADIYRAQGDELRVFLPMIRHLTEEAGATVLLLTHVFRTDPETGRRIQGPEFEISRQLYELLEKEGKHEHVHLIRQTLTPQEAKGIFNRLDLFVSGRMHAAIGALSQAVPTVILAYGHKQYGMTRILGTGKYIYGGKDPDRMMEVVSRGWRDRDATRKVLEETSVVAKRLAELNLVITRDLLTLPPDGRTDPPNDMVDGWRTQSFRHDDIDPDRVLEEISIPH